MDEFDVFKLKMNIRGGTRKERMYKAKERGFTKFFNEALNASECFINGKPATLVFQDHSQYNNKDLSDDKYIVGPNHTPFGIGDYITWNSSEWLVFTEEYKTIPTHQQAKVKRVNQTLLWIDKDGHICNDGKGWGVYTQSQTLYTLGVASTPYISVVDSKRMFYIQFNDEAAKIKMGQRFYIGNRVYITNYMDEVSRPGLISVLVDETTAGPNDNPELRIADYYLHHKDDSNVTIPEENTQTINLTGNLSPKLGGEYAYESDVDITEWLFDVETVDLPFTVISREDRILRIKFKDDFGYIGRKVSIIAKTGDGSLASIGLTITKKY